MDWIPSGDQIVPMIIDLNTHKTWRLLTLSEVLFVLTCLWCHKNIQGNHYNWILSPDQTVSVWTTTKHCAKFNFNE